MLRSPCPAILILSSLAVVSCGGGSSSPTAPTQTVSTPTPTPTPTPALQVTFTPQTTVPVGRAIAIVPSDRGVTDGMVSLAVNVYNMPAFHQVRGEIRWNPALFEFDAWGKGTMLDNDGMDWTFYTSTPGEISLYLTYPSTLPARSGSGEVIAFRLKPKSGVRSGSSQVVWNDPRVLTSGFSSVGLQNAYGGTITIQ